MENSFMSNNYADLRDRQGRWTRQRRLREAKVIIIGSLIILGFILSFRAYVAAAKADPGASRMDQAVHDERTVEIAGGVQGARGGHPNRQVDTRDHVDLTDPATAIVAAQVKTWYTTMDASVSAYSLTESCHNRKNGVCIAANGKAPMEGKTVACTRSLPLGTRVMIKGVGEYTCQDRTAKWIETKYGPTFDIFMNDQKAALEFGRQTLEVTIIYDTH
jgi:3D (Asp-Asp-Asp) domain-containing protein